MAQQQQFQLDPEELEKELKDTVKEMNRLFTKKRTQMILRPQLIFWATLSLRLKPQSTMGIPTMATDGVTLMYNPLFLKYMIDAHGRNDGGELIISAIAHEVMHCALTHMVRRGDRDPKLFNIAADFAVNLVLRDSGFPIGNGWMIDDKYRGMSVEEIYADLQQNAQQMPQNGDAQKTMPGGVMDHPGTGSGEDDEDQDGQGQDKGQDQKDKGGGKSGGNPLSPAEKAKIAADWKIAAANAAKQHAAKAGSLPGGLKEIVDSTLNPKVPWSEIVREWAEEIAKNDYSWSRPNKRYMPQGFYLPDLYSVEVGKVVLFFDTSGSVSTQQSSQFCAEMSSILEEFDCEVYAIQVDTHVQDVRKYTRDELPINEVEIHGRGGTNFRPGFEYIEKEGIEPVGIIYFTDMGCSSFPEEAPDCPVIWVKYGHDSYYNTKPEDIPFGDYVEM